MAAAALIRWRPLLHLLLLVQFNFFFFIFQTRTFWRQTRSCQSGSFRSARRTANLWTHRRRRETFPPFSRIQPTTLRTTSSRRRALARSTCFSVCRLSSACLLSGLFHGFSPHPSHCTSKIPCAGREIKPWVRPIASPENASVVVSPADCTYALQLPINKTTLRQQFRVKNSFTNLEKLLEGSGIDLDRWCFGEGGGYLRRISVLIAPITDPQVYGRVVYAVLPGNERLSPLPCTDRRYRHTPDGPPRSQAHQDCLDSGEMMGPELVNLHNKPTAPHRRA